jgi:hypothetical protein
VSGVNFSPALKWFVLLLLPLTLAWKVTVRPVDGTEPMDRMAEFLIHHHFQVAEETVRVGMPIAVATTLECRMVVGVPSSYGSHRDAVRDLASATDQVFTVFRGSIYAEQPVWATAFYRLWSKFLRETGIGSDITPVYAVIAAQSCNAKQLPWNQLG